MAGRKADKQADKYPDRHSDIIALALLLRRAIGWHRRVSTPADSSSFTDVHPLFTYAAYLGRDEYFVSEPSYLLPDFISFFIVHVVTTATRMKSLTL